jgi:hypothetical protein
VPGKLVPAPVRASRAAVVMTACRRPYYLRRVLESWAGVRGVGDLAVFRVSLDASDRAAEMAEVAEGALFPVSLVLNLPPLGVSVNPVEAGSAVFRQYPDVDFLVLAEEDLLVASDVLEYMAWGAENFQAAQEVLAVRAHPGEEGRDIRACRLVDGFSPWVWGTWRDRWAAVLAPTWDRSYSTGDAECPAAGFDWNIDKRVMPKRGLRCLVPEVSRSQNIGEQEGVHALPEDFASTVLASFREYVPPQRYRLA